jgi:hypothetical protein
VCDERLIGALRLRSDLPPLIALLPRCARRSPVVHARPTPPSAICLPRRPRISQEGYRRFRAGEIAMAEPAEYGLGYLTQFESVPALWGATSTTATSSTGSSTASTPSGRASTGPGPGGFLVDSSLTR